VFVPARPARAWSLAARASPPTNLVSVAVCERGTAGLLGRGLPWMTCLDHLLPVGLAEDGRLRWHGSPAAWPSGNDLSRPRAAPPPRGWARGYDGRRVRPVLPRRFARFLGTGKFLVGQTVLVIGWIILNTIGIIKHWDPVPVYPAQNLAFSTQAAYAPRPLIPAGAEPAGRPGTGPTSSGTARWAARTPGGHRVPRPANSPLSASRLSDVVTTKDLEGLHGGGWPS